MAKLPKIRFVRYIRYIIPKTKEKVNIKIFAKSQKTIDTGRKI